MAEVGLIIPREYAAAVRVSELLEDRENELPGVWRVLIGRANGRQAPLVWIAACSIIAPHALSLYREPSGTSHRISHGPRRLQITPSTR